MENDQLMTKEEFLTLNHSNFSKFKVNPLDLNIAKMQMVISNEVNAVIKGEKEPAGFQNEYKSKDPTLLIGLITIDYQPEKEHVCKLVLTVHSRDESSKDTIDLFQGSYDELAVYLSGSSFLGICKGHVYWFNYLLKKK